MLKVGLTGGIGCGKSTAVNAFRALGVAIIDADQIAKDLVQPGQISLVEIAAKLGEEFLLKDGSLNRPLLKEKVFSNPELLERLEAILHPRVKAEINRRFMSLAALPEGSPYIIADVPLLYEKGYEALFDRIIVVDCLPEQQIARVKSRDGMDGKTINRIMKTQASREDRLGIATDVLDNTKNKDTLLEQINALHLEFLALA